MILFSPFFVIGSYLYSRATGTPPLIKYIIATYIVVLSLPALLGAGGPLVQIIASLLVIYITINVKRDTE